MWLRRRNLGTVFDQHLWPRFSDAQSAAALPASAAQTTMWELTCNAHICLPALRGARGAPGHALAPVVFRPEEFFHLLARNLNAHFPYNETWGEKRRLKSAAACASEPEDRILHSADHPCCSSPSRCSLAWPSHFLQAALTSPTSFPFSYCYSKPSKFTWGPQQSKQHSAK